MNNKQEWKNIELSDVILDIAAGPFGSNLKVDCFVPSGFPIIDGANLKEFELTDNISKFVTEEKARSLSRSIAKRGDVVVTISGTIGQISYIPSTSRYSEYLCSQRQFRVSFDQNKVYAPYLVFYFHTYDGQSKILSFANQTGVPALSQPLKNFKKLTVKLPCLSEQIKIAHVIETINTKIKANCAINDNLLKQAQMLYSKFFPYKVDDIIPDGWRIGTVAEIIEIHDSRRVPLSGQSRDKMKQRVYPYYGAASLMDYVDDYIFDGKYLLLGEDGTVIDDYGYPILQYVWGKFWVNNHAHILTGKNGFNIESLYMLFRHTSVRSIVTGAVQAKISQVNLQSIPVIIPPKEKLNEYNHLVEPLFALYRKNVEENRTLASIRDALLPKLMTGQISINSIKGLSH